MRISTGTGTIDTSAVQRVSEAEAAPAAGAAAAAPAALQSAVLQPALAALRDALAKGELPFDANKLAGLIQRFHGSDK